MILLGNTIWVNRTSLQHVAALLEQGVDDYCSLRLMSLGGVAPVAGSAEHDGTIASLLQDALSSYASIIGVDSVVVRGIGDTFDQADAKVAMALGGK